MTLKMESTVEKTLPAAEQIRQPYPPSWVDRFEVWVERLPVPAWAFYLGLWMLLIIVESCSKWLDGVEPFIRVRSIYVLYTFYGVYFLAAIHYLDSWAKTAFNTFRPILTAGEAEQSVLFYHLTTMPARTILLLSAATLASMIVLFKPLIIPLWEAMGFFHHTIAATLLDLGLYAFNGLIVIIFVYHTLHQLSWISKIYKKDTHINLFQLRPLYSFSGLTARTAGILLLVGYIIQQQAGAHSQFTSNPYVLRTSWLFMLMSIVVYSALAMAVFFLPLLGLHQLLLDEKERLQAEVDGRLQAHIQELHQRIDARQLQDADAINKHMGSLALERDILSKLPTWPWQPGTLNFILTAVLLPFILWFMQRLLERWAGF